MNGGRDQGSGGGNGEKLLDHRYVGGKMPDMDRMCLEYLLNE